MTDSFTTTDFLAAMKGYAVTAWSPVQTTTTASLPDVGFGVSVFVAQSSEHDRFESLTKDLFGVAKDDIADLMTPADAAREHWRWDKMPKTMHRLA